MATAIVNQLRSNTEASDSASSSGGNANRTLVTAVIAPSEMPR